MNSAPKKTTKLKPFIFLSAAFSLWDICFVDLALITSVLEVLLKVLNVIRWVLLLPASLAIASAAQFLVWNALEFMSKNNPLSYWIFTPVISGIAYCFAAIIPTYHLAPIHKQLSIRAIMVVFIIVAVVLLILGVYHKEWQLVVNMAAIVATASHIASVQPPENPHTPAGSTK